mgnify:FL=1
MSYYKFVMIRRSTGTRVTFIQRCIPANVALVADMAIELMPGFCCAVYNSSEKEYCENATL